MYSTYTCANVVLVYSLDVVQEQQEHPCEIACEDDGGVGEGRLGGARVLRVRVAGVGDGEQLWRRLGRQGGGGRVVRRRHGGQWTAERESILNSGLL